MASQTRKPRPTAKAVAPVTTKRSSTVAKRSPASKPAAEAAAPPADVTPSKQKLVRDSFTIPKSEYLLLQALKLRAAKLARPTKKSELLRAGIRVLHLMTDKALLTALGGVPTLKTGRPKGATPSKAKVA